MHKTVTGFQMWYNYNFDSKLIFIIKFKIKNEFLNYDRTKCYSQN